MLTKRSRHLLLYRRRTERVASVVREAIGSALIPTNRSLSLSLVAPCRFTPAQSLNMTSANDSSQDTIPSNTPVLPANDAEEVRKAEEHALKLQLQRR